MNKLASRRAFLRGRALRENPDAIRPPGAALAAFHELCTQCNDCAAACPENIITFDAQGWPVVDLTASACTFCAKCADACPTGALQPERVADWPWRASVMASCLSLNGVSCRVCQDSCDNNAIRFKPQLGGRSEPVLDQLTCSGCGACASACPASAVSFTRIDPQPTESPQ